MELAKIEISGSATLAAVGLDAFKAQALEFVGNINTDPIESDEQLAAARKDVALLKEIESRCDEAKQLITDSSASVREIVAALNEIKNASSDARKRLTKHATEASQAARQKLCDEASEHYASALRELAQSCPLNIAQLRSKSGGFAATDVIKGLKSINSMRKELEGAAGSAIGKAREVAHRANDMASTLEHSGAKHLFPDAQVVIYASESIMGLEMLIESRKREEAQREEAKEAERRAAEERKRLEAERAAEAEQRRIETEKAEEARKAKEHQRVMTMAPQAHASEIDRVEVNRFVKPEITDDHVQAIKEVVADRTQAPQGGDDQVKQLVVGPREVSAATSISTINAMISPLRLDEQATGKIGLRCAGGMIDGSASEIISKISVHINACAKLWGA